MDILQGLPVWMQLAIAVLVAAVLIFMNIGWLMQARNWLTRKGQNAPGMTGQLPGRQTGAGSATSRSRADRA
ncbi:MAG: hypothetical protein U0893_00630 [Chloroflexota bacterium]